MRGSKTSVHLVVDGVFFQRSQSGIARVWASVLPILARRSDLSVTLLNRGNAPKIEGVSQFDFPSWSARFTADDSLLIERICKHLGADVFTSTYFTTPVSTPMFLLLHDMIPELFGFELNDKEWMEKQLAITYARDIICVSNNTRRDLSYFYPSIPDESVQVAYNGVDYSLFRIHHSEEVSDFNLNSGLTGPICLWLGRGSSI